MKILFQKKRDNQLKWTKEMINIKNRRNRWKAILDSYIEDNTLLEADIFHLYDTKRRCYVKNDGYWTSRHFILWIFNSETKTKRNLGQHDGVKVIDNIAINSFHVFTDGSFVVQLKQLTKVDNFQCVYLNKI